MAPEFFEEFLKLPRSTAECDEGPEVLLRPGVLVVRYDAEGASESVWTTLRFVGALALRVIPEPCVSPMSARAYSSVGIVNNSVWLESLVKGGGDGALTRMLKHFVVFFDHYGSIETVAATCEILE